MRTDSPERITFLLLHGFSNMVLTSAVEPLRAACDLSGRSPFEWRVATLDGGAAVSSSGLRLEPDVALADTGGMQVLIVVAGYGVRALLTDTRIPPMLNAAARRADRVAGLDMGAWALAAAGVLNGRRATVHWHEIEAFGEEFLEVDVRSAGFVIDDNRLSAGSATSAMDLTLELIRQRAGDMLAYDVRSLFIHDDAERRRAQSGALSPKLGRAVREMLATLGEPQPLPRIAASAAVSVRTLERMARRELGVSAGEYYRGLRLQHARNLVTETNISARIIAVRSGFSSASTLSRAFHAYFGRTLRSMRGSRDA